MSFCTTTLIRVVCMRYIDASKRTLENDDLSISTLF